jgi:hypothetical protein
MATVQSKGGVMTDDASRQNVNEDQIADLEAPAEAQSDVAGGAHLPGSLKWEQIVLKRGVVGSDPTPESPQS